MMMLIMITKRPANASQIPFILPSLTIQPKSWPPLTCKKVQFFSSTLNFWYFKRNLSVSETQISKNIFPPQFEISQFFPETKSSSSLVWTTCKEVALLQICLFVGFWFLSLHLTHSWSQKLSALEVRVAKKIAPLPICGSPSPTEAWLKQRSYFRNLFTPILNFYKLSPIFNFHKLFRLTSKIFSHHKLNLKSTFLNFGQIHLSILSHLKLNFAAPLFFFAQPKHFAFLAPSIKLTLVVTTLQRWLIYWKKPLPLPLPCPLLFVANASVICCHCHCYLLFQILTFLVTEGSLMAKGLHQGLLGTIK